MRARRGRAPVRLAGAALAALLALAGPAAARAAALDWLHVEANSGGSSGGHAALRLGDRVFDFQHGEGGTLRLRRSTWEGFRQRTAIRGNRTIHAARVELAPEQLERIARAFDARFLVWDRHFEVWDALRGDRELLARLQVRREAEGAAALPALEGAGLFAQGAGAAPSTALRALQARVAERHGPGFLAARRRAAEAELAALRPAGDPASPPAITPERLPRREYAFSERWRDLAQWVAALHALEAAAPLREGVLREAGAEAGALALAAPEARALGAWAHELEDSLVALAGSRRVDGGLALGVGMARLEAVRRSLAAGRLLLLDDFPAGAEAHPVRAGDPHLEELHAHAAARLTAARAQLVAAQPIGEADYDALEEAGNDWLELAGALRGGRPLRLHDGERIPAPPAAPSELPEPAIPRAELGRAAAAAGARERAYQRALREAFAYRLVTRNCVTELFAALAAAGGPAEPGGALRFVPFASLDAVVASWPVSERWQEPAFRRARLAALYAEHNDLLVYLRESNTLTSTLYRPDPGQPFFLFFGDDAPLLRPLLGAANLAAGLAHAALGVARAPFDRGRSLRDGLESAAYSLPELAFVSIRKGTMRHAPPPVGPTTGSAGASLVTRAAAPSAP
jgi:hypothetical protein